MRLLKIEMKFRFILLLLFVTSFGFSQNAELDSLWNVWKDSKQPDSARLSAIYDFAWNGYLNNKPDSAYYYSKFMMDFSIKESS